MRREREVTKIEMTDRMTELRLNIIKKHFGPFGIPYCRVSISQMALHSHRAREESAFNYLLVI